MRSFGLTQLLRSVVLAVLTAVVFPAAGATLNAGGGVPQTRLVLPAMYAQSVFLKFVLGSYGKSDQEKIQAVKDAEAAIARFAFQTRHMLQVTTLKELDHMRDLYFPPFYTLEDALHFRKTEEPPAFFALISGSSEVDDAIEALRTRQEKRLEAFANLNSAMNQSISQMSVNKMIFTVLNNPTPVKIGFGLVDDRARLAVANFMHGEIGKGIGQIDSTGQLIAGSGSIQHADPKMQRFFQLAIGEYFRGLDTKEKLNIIADFLDNPDQSAPSEKFEMMVMNSGPQFQKLFQVYAREEGFSTEMKTIFKRLESNVRPAPWRLVEPMIRAEKVSFQWVEISPQPLGVGTMAQVHRAKIRLANGAVHEVVVRIMKPGIAKRLAADNQVLKGLAPTVDNDPLLRSLNFPQITPFIDEIISMGMNELNVPATVQAQKMGALTYDRDVTVTVTTAKGARPVNIRFHVPKIYDLDPASTMMVQEFVPGRSLEAFAHEHPELGRAAIEELAKIWTETALMGSGFYHADLHQGNLRVTESPGGLVQLNILDFGMSGQIDGRMQSQIIALAAIVSTNRADLIARAIWEVSLQKENKISLTRLQELVRKELNRQSSINPAVAGDFGSWVALAAQEGIKFPASFSSLNRGITLMGQMLRNQGSPLFVEDIVKAAIKRNPMILRSAMKSMESISRSEWMGVIWSTMTGSRPAEVAGGSATTSANQGGRSCNAVFK